VIVLFALTLVVLMGALMLGVDLIHLRTEAENVQRTANAAALAGVVFLPDYPNNAYYRAKEEASRNGFIGGQKGAVVTPETVSGYGGRLKVTVTEPVPLYFGRIFGLGPVTVSRSAIAEYDQPLQLGAPDYVLGYPLFPTNVVTPTVGVSPTQGFYLEARGPYGLQENGDPYSQYYESYAAANGSFQPGGTGVNTSLTNPCTALTPTTGTDGCPRLKANPDAARIGGFTGYNFIVDNPLGNTLVIKLFDPFDEGAYDQDSGNSLSTQALTGPNGGSFGNKLPDQWGCNDGHGTTKFCTPSPALASTTEANPYPVALQFQISGPYQTLFDTAQRPITQTPTISVTGTSGGYTCATDCVLAAPFTAGDDPTHATCHALNTCDKVTSPYAYKFLNYAIVHGKGLFRIHVNVTANTAAPYGGTYGTGGNIFGLAACADPTSRQVLGTPSDPSAGGVNGAAVSDPYTTGGATPGWNQASCTNPNTAANAPAACANPGTAPTGTCVHIYALDRMCIINELTAGKSLIPLGYVPPEYGGQTLQIKLYDPGDVTTDATLHSNATLQVLTPAGDLQHTGTATNSGFPAGLPYTYEAAPTDQNNPGQNNSGSGYKSATVTPPQPADTPIVATDANGVHPFNGSWLNIHVPINLPNNQQYANMVSAFGGYWKMLYNIGGVAADTTTWEISVNGAPVHLISSS